MTVVSSVDLRISLFSSMKAMVNLMTFSVLTPSSGMQTEVELEPFHPHINAESLTPLTTPRQYPELRESLGSMTDSGELIPCSASLQDFKK